MELEYNFSENDFVSLCLENLKRSKTTVSQDLCEALQHFLGTPSSVLVSEVKHCYKHEFYDEHLSLKEYRDQGKLALPYVQFDLSSSKNVDLEITDIKLPSFINLTHFQYGGGVTSRYKIKNRSLKTKNKSSINLLTVEFSRPLLEKLFSLAISPEPESVLPSKLGVWEWRQTFYNKITGEVSFCSCFMDALESDYEPLSIKHSHLQRALKQNSFKEGICHLCTKSNSDLAFCHEMYGSAFKVKYGAYIRKFEIQEGIDEKEAENKVRDLKGVARIGERWINETLLFNYIQVLFPDRTVQREASPNWLNRQRFDVYIPELRLAVEYQGQQHYVPVELFGGKEGLKKTKQRDKEKLQRSKENGVDIIYFSYKDNLSEKLVHNRLKKYLTEAK